MTDQTEGQRRVRVKFNPSGDDAVYQMKMDAAALIDAVLETGIDKREAAIAVTHFETACMYAVKSLTAEAQ